MNPSEPSWNVWTFSTKYFTVDIEIQPTHATMKTATGWQDEWLIEARVFCHMQVVARADKCIYLATEWVDQDDEGNPDRIKVEQLRDLDFVRDLAWEVLGKAREFFFDLPRIRKQPVVKRIAMKAMNLLEAA